jgi:hypothetical protein
MRGWGKEKVRWERAGDKQDLIRKGDVRAGRMER